MNLTFQDMPRRGSGRIVGKLDIERRNPPALGMAGELAPSDSLSGKPLEDQHQLMRLGVQSPDTERRKRIPIKNGEQERVPAERKYQNEKSYRYYVRCVGYGRHRVGGGQYARHVEI
jgi:hypothetical protein